MISETLTRAEQIARLNDRARQGLDRTALVNFTRACLAEFCSDDTPSGLLAQAEMMKAMRQHAFVNDAHGERDFGQMTFHDTPVWFKIDLYEETFVKHVCHARQFVRGHGNCCHAGQCSNHPKLAVAKANAEA